VDRCQLTAGRGQKITAEKSPKMRRGVFASSRAKKLSAGTLERLPRPNLKACVLLHGKSSFRTAS
jgi:hypothetical protein